MKHFWINIDKNEKRQQFMSKQYQNLGLENYRVSAFTPNDFDVMLAHSRPLTCKYPGCTTCEYEFACLCSHIKAMQAGLETGDDYFVIMEDDIYMPFKIDYESFIQSIPQNSCIIQLLILYGPTVLTLYELYKNTKQDFIKWRYLLPSAGMYIISKQGAQKIVDLFYNKNTKKYDFSSSPFQTVADVLLYQTVTSYSTTLPYAFPNIEMGSEIHESHLENHAKAIKDIKIIVQKHESEKFPHVLEYFGI